VKWLITNKANGRRRYPTDGIPRNTGTHTAIPNSGIEDDLVQYLIIYKKAQPKTPVMSDSLDWMYCWGRSVDICWYSHIVDLLHFLLHHGVHLSDQVVLTECRIRTLVHSRGLDAMTIVVERHTFFDKHYDFGTTAFYNLAVYSIQWFENRYAIPTTPAVFGPAVVMSSP
jgi:hypothetical protein